MQSLISAPAVSVITHEYLDFLCTMQKNKWLLLLPSFLKSSVNEMPAVQCVCVPHSGCSSVVDADELARESEDVKENVKRKFLVQMPEDFYQFWEFCKSLNPSDPQGTVTLVYMCTCARVHV